MADNTIELIRQAELKAEEIIRAARETAESKVDGARAEAVRLHMQQSADAREAADREVSAAREENARLLERALAELSGDLEALRTGAQKKQDEAAELVLKALA